VPGSPSSALQTIADHVFHLARRVAAGNPLGRRFEPGAALPAQTGLDHLFQDRLRATLEHRPQRRTVGEMPPQQDIGAADVADHLEKFTRPLRQWDLPIHQFGDPIQARFVEASERITVHQRRRSLVAHTGAGRRTDCDYSIDAGFTDLDAQPLAKVVQQFAIAEHPVGDVVAEEEVVGTARRGVKEGIEFGDAAHLGRGNVEFLGDPVQGLGRQPGQVVLHVAQDLQQPGRRAAVALDDFANRLGR